MVHTGLATVTACPPVRPLTTAAAAQPAQPPPATCPSSNRRSHRIVAVYQVYIKLILSISQIIWRILKTVYCGINVKLHIPVLLAILVALAPAAHADNLANGLQQPFDWAAAWGAINFAPNGVDPGIPSAQLQPKDDIKRVVEMDGTQSTNLSSLKAYQVDMNGDGKLDYVIDGNGYFPQYQNPNGALQICSAADGCYLSIYLSGQDTNLISAAAPDAPSCPASAAANTSCVASCSATEENCPALFQYNTRTIFNQQVLKWNVISAAAFQAWAQGKSYQMYNDNAIFVALRNNTNCYNDELALNNNQCVKYYQYVGDVNTGSLVDLYVYEAGTAETDDTRFTYTSFDRQTAYEARGMAMGDGFAHRLNAGGTLDIQIRNFTPPKNADGSTPAPIPGSVVTPSLSAWHITNHSANDLFVPANTDTEFWSFLNAAQHLDVAVEPEHLQFTAWTGDTQCPAALTAPQSIAAQRFCISSTSDYRPCSACMDAARAANGAGWPGDWQQGCTVAQSCPATGCVFHERPADPYIGSAALKSYNGTVTTLAECEANPPQGVWSVLFQSYYDGENVVDFEGGCVGAFQHLCARGNFCLSGETLISMADGRAQRIDQLKAGDMVLGFDKPTSPLKPYKVKLVAVTPAQKLVSINGTLRLTPNHDVVNAKGHKIRASLLKAGDTLLRADGSTLLVERVETVPATSTVYNLELDGAGTGFVADGLRVVGYSK